MPYDIILGRDESDKKKLGKRGTIFIGKSFVKMGQYTSLSNNILLDVSKSHVILVVGKRGSGKSHSLGVIMEEISDLPEDISQNISSVIFDTMGIYWTMRYKNEKEKKLLSEWNLKPKNLPVKVFVPYGKYESYVSSGIVADEKFALDVSEMNSEDWIITFNLEITNPIAVLIQRTISELKKKEYFNIEGIIKELKSDHLSEKEVKNAAIGMFQAAEEWGVFAKSKEDSTSVKDLTTGGITTVLDLSTYNSVGTYNVRALVISLVSRKIFNSRMESRRKEEVESVSRGLDFLSRNIKKEDPLVWLFVDEVHEFLTQTGKTPATDALVQLLREGRQPGISLVLATQQPGKIHTDAMTQSDIVISHRLTSAQDLNALNSIMQSYVLDSINKQMNDLPGLKGSAIILDDNSERIYPMRIRPRFTWHGGDAPTAIDTKNII